MPFCNKCGHGVAVDATVCPSCGEVFNQNDNNTANANQNQYNSYNQYNQAPPRAPYESPEEAAVRRQRVIDNFYLRLKWELKAWSIASKVFTILGSVLMFITAVMFVMSFVGGEDTIGMLFFAMYYGFFASMILGIGIINVIMKGKVQKYMDGLYYDCGPAVVRGESIGMIIFEYFFNNIALVFFVINFIHIKTNKAVFDEIRHLQYHNNRANNNNTYYGN